MNKFFTSIFCLFFGFSQVSLAQTPKQQQELLQLQTEMQQQKQLAVEKAQALGLEVRKELPNGVIIELMHLSPTGMPVYLQTVSNLDAAKTISTNKVWPAGSLGLNLTGSGMTNRLGVWDGGATRTTHQEFQGRAVQSDGATTFSDHATHVSGTMAAGGVTANAKGGAYQAPIKCYDWNSDLNEMIAAAQAGMLVSNHSYSQVSGWNFESGVWKWYGDVNISSTEDYKYGFYDNISQNWDAQLISYPYYLPFVAAGNDRGEPSGSIPTNYQIRNSVGQWVTGDPGSPPARVGPYNCISGGSQNAKNTLTVGAVNKIASGWTKTSDVVMSSFSGWGPTDDGRIKPDVVAAGVSIYSSSSSSNTAYNTQSGTSMATPNASGSALLIQQHYQNIKGGFMRASTLKGLIIHTADEAGNAGPDYTFGWGLMNTAKAVQTISDTAKNVILEPTLANKGTYTYNLFTDGTQPLRITISWTDRAGTSPAPSLNPTTKMLVNDLDLRLKRNSDNQLFEPYILNVAAPTALATTGDNTTDNVEQIYIAAPVAGNYQIVVNHKGNLALNASQVFSLIVTGIVPKPSISFSVASKVICTNRTVLFSDQSSGGTSRMWYFPGGSPATSTSASPLVSYSVPGNYPVALRISNANGFDSVYVSDYITVGGLKLPFLETFENNSETRSLWTIDNPNNDTTWRLWPVAGNTPGNLAMGINNFDAPKLWFLDRLVSPILDLRGYQSAQMQFQHAYTRYDNTTWDSLVVYISTNCGNSWTRLNSWAENGTGNFATALDANYASTNAFTPSKAADWCGAGPGANCFTVNLTPYVGNANVRIRFEQNAHEGNNMFIDNISITATELQPVANFYSLKKQVCQNEMVQFMDSSLNNPTNFEWTFTGANIAKSTLKNPLASFATAGTYAVKLKVWNGIGSDSIEKTNYITVMSGPTKPGLTANKASQLCDGDSITLTTTATTNYIWFKDSIARTTIKTTDWLVKDEANYFVRTYDVTGCYTQSDIIKVTSSVTPAKPSITKSLTNNVFCDGGTFTLTSSSTANNQWFYNDTLWSNQINTQLQYTDSGNFSVRVGEKGCYNISDKLRLDKLPRPQTSEINGVNWAAKGDTSIFNIVRAEPNSTITWSLAGGTMLYGQGTNNLGVKFGTGSQTTVSVYEKGENGCNSAIKTIVVSLVNTGITENIRANQVFVYPNPVSDILHVKYNAPTMLQTNIKVYDVLGKLILNQQNNTQTGENTLEINTADLINGYYILSIEQGDQLVKTKFVKH